MSRPIALLTDFGYRDAYVGTMKGVILSRCPEARIFDLTHGIPRQDVLAGALQLATAAPYWPADTVFLAVVDPGVGGSRRAVCLRGGTQLFVGPDNGLLWPAASRSGPPEVFHLDRPRYWLPEPGTTFHGRDIFAPIAAHLAQRRAPEDLGTPLSDPVRLEVPRCVFAGGDARGEVIALDHYGNAITNLRPADLDFPEPRCATFVVGDLRLTGPATHYAAAPPGEPLVVLGSLGYYEVAINGGSAAERLGLQRGSLIVARPT
jgi:S-adenosylmethionine hydrolase